MKTKVAVVACPDYSEENVRKSLSRAVGLLGGLSRLLDDRRVMIKPNLCLPTHYNNHLTTHPQIIRQLGVLLKEMGLRVAIADTPVGKSDSQRRERLWELTGVNEVLQELGVERNDLEKHIAMHYAEIENSAVSLPISLDVFEHQIINVPKLKTHGFMLLTGCVKNIYGVLPEYSKKRLHRELEEKHKFSQLLLELYRMADCRFNVLDAVIGIQGEGPGAKGEPCRIGLIIAGEDGVAVDSVAARIMNTHPLSVPTNYYAQKLGTGQTDLTQIEIVGENIEDYIVPDYKLPIIDRHTDRLTQKLFHLSRYSVDVVQELCRLCGVCIKNCPGGAMSIENDRVAIHDGKCKACLVCHEICPHGAIKFTQYSFLKELSNRRSLPKKSTGTPGAAEDQSKWILLVGNPDSQHMFRKIKSRGYKIALLHDKNPRTDFSLCDVVTRETDLRMWDAYKIEGVVNCQSERNVVRCAEICEHLGLPGLGVNLARTLANKKLLKRVFAENNINTASYGIFSSYRELSAELHKFRPPYVLKPVDNSNTRGVFLLQDGELSDKIFEQALTCSESREVVLEEFVPGEEDDVTCVVYDNEIVFLFANKRIRHEQGRRFGTAIGFQTVAHSGEKMYALEQLCRKCIKALEVKNGVVSFQVIDGVQGWSVVEMAGRLMGGGIYEFIYAAAGVDMYSVLLDLATNRQLKGISQRRGCRPTAYLFAGSILEAPREQGLKLAGVHQARKVPGVFMLNVDLKSTTDRVSGKQHRELTGGVLCFGENDESAMESAYTSLHKLTWANGIFDG
jgi:uncharacterized protein (DUF362 family)/biotin carboxylase/ferredoxin-like protein FixX